MARPDFRCSVFQRVAQSRHSIQTMMASAERAPRCRTLVERQPGQQATCAMVTVWPGFHPGTIPSDQEAPPCVTQFTDGSLCAYSQRYKGLYYVNVHPLPLVYGSIQGVVAGASSAGGSSDFAESPASQYRMSATA